MSFRFDLYLLLLISTCTSDIILNTHNGKLKGSTLMSTDGATTYSFKHIPFAAPPVGRLRFELPQKAHPWKEIRDATSYGPACMSNSSTTHSPQKWMSEDCLHVNIFTSKKCLVSRDCPVIFYIHGGSFQYDSAVMNNDEKIVDNFASQDIVFVIPAMRLGFFSLLAFPNDEVVVRNMPYHDLKASLEWVQESISEFGGNADDVTLLGHSSGGAAALDMTMSNTFDPQAKLFKKSIGMSAGYRYSDYTTMQMMTWTFAQRLGCAGDLQNPSNNMIKNVVECLKNKDGMELLRVQRELEEKDNLLPGMIPMLPPMFQGKNYQEFLDQAPPNRKILIGTTTVEFSKTILANVQVSISSLLDSLQFKNPLFVEPMYIRDMNNKIGPYDKSTKTQGLFNTMILTANSYTKVGGEVYLYQYGHPKHALHTDDLFYLMGIHEFEMDENEQVLSVLYPTMFTDFVKTGKPGEAIEYNPEYTNYYNVNYNITDGTKPHNSVGYEKVCIDYFEKTLRKYDMEISTLRMASKVNNPWRKGVPEITFRAVQLEETENSHTFLLSVGRPLLIICFVPLGIFIGWRIRGRNENINKNYQLISEKSSLLH